MISYNFKDKVIVVTGTGGVLGPPVIDRLEKAGANVFAPTRKAPEKAQANPGAVNLPLNALDEQSVKSYFEAVVAQAGRLDGLVNLIGGFAMGDPVASLPLEVFERQLDLNLKTAFLLTRYALQAMNGPTGGKIVLVSSRAAVDKGLNSFPYSVSKLGVLRLVEAVAAENHAKNININAILPSIIDSAENRAAMPEAKFDKWPKAEQIASVIAFLLSDEAGLINGAAIPVYGKA
jgi:NAD(P)-dependent dehydrogenase (short-subunit alcohol dehydrogenase family)